jgi:uncharacterized SAM-binding protein YcdF (DUF218 family)
MILLVLILASWTYLAVRLMNSRRARPAVALVAAPAVDTQPEPWGRLDDLQLTRLLRHAARGD